MPQEPQLDISEDKLTSHPFAALASQFPNPILQVITHAPAVHDAVAFKLEHTLPQEPQLDREVFKFTSHPSVLLLLQFPKPELQEDIEQVPEVQVAVAFAKEQVLLHWPQLVILVSTLVSQPSAKF